MKLSNLIYIIYLLPFLISCQSNSPAAEAGPEVKVQTPVTVTSVSTQPVIDSVELNATSSFLQKSFVKASSNGYIRSVNIQMGKQVNKGSLLFTLITKEAKAIGNSINKLDPGFKFSGITDIKANENGFISQMNHQLGDYVQDGEQLAVISNTSSFVFLLNLPYSMHQIIQNHKNVELTLPDGEKLPGMLSSSLSTLDSASQTERLIIKVHFSHAIPENLIAKVKIIKTDHSQVNSLPKSAVLANETQDEFWVMRLINDTTAVKVPVKKGIEGSDQIEIISPVFKSTDRIILTGNYGLSDTAKVKVIKK
ncbi:MAG: transporter [Sphingobacteriales bacterium]|nr:transporter [Sphingobacteriales bacterium]